MLIEPPFAIDDAVPPAGLPERLHALVLEGRNGDAVALFQRDAVGLPETLVAGLRRAPEWSQLEALAPSLVYDAAVTAAYPRPDAVADRTARRRPR